MKFTQINSMMIQGPKGPFISVFALGEDGFVYNLNRTSGKDYWDRMVGEVRDAPLVESLPTVNPLQNTFRSN